MPHAPLAVGHLHGLYGRHKAPKVEQDGLGDDHVSTEQQLHQHRPARLGLIGDELCKQSDVAGLAEAVETDSKELASHHVQPGLLGVVLGGELPDLSTSQTTYSGIVEYI